ncbi:MAG: HIT domain-containing protein [Deltaproteobacteria bacterium]|nr:HIT domain-containing protein [Deltaproteobacteria bacterium]
MDDCIFCKIIKGDIPADVVYRDERFLAFLDIRPINRGHVLVIPLVHAERLTDLPDDLLAAELPLARRIASAVLEVTGATDFNLFNTNGVEAGQEVFHHHIHIIPRHAGDGLTFNLNPVSYNEGEASELAGRIGNVMTS